MRPGSEQKSPPPRHLAAAGLLAALASGALAAALDPMPEADARRLARAFRLARALGEEFWPGWSEGRFAVLLLGETTEYLVGGPEPAPGFLPSHADALDGVTVGLAPRQRPADLLATFPLLPGLPAVVIGSPAATGLDDTAWIATVLHERLHQVQMSDPGYFAGVEALELAGGDTTGMWMLEYPFPYGDAAVGEAFAGLSAAVLAALDAAPGPGLEAARAAAVTAYDELLATLSGPDRRYLEFQLWQEGVARYVEWDAARRIAGFGRASAGASGSALAPGLPGSGAFSDLAARLGREIRQRLARPDLARDGRLAFYDLGAGLAQLLDDTAPGWRQRYGGSRFALRGLFEPTPGHAAEAAGE